MPLCSQDFQHLSPVDGIKGLPKVNESYYCRKLICFFCKPAQSQNISNRDSANSESILVSPKVTVQYRSNSIEDKSIVRFGHKRAETSSSVVAT